MEYKFKESLKNNTPVSNKTLNLPKTLSSLSFIVKEYKHGFKYASSQIEKVIYIIDPKAKHESESTPKELNIEPKQPQSALICKDDSLLCIGTMESEILVFSIQENPAYP